MERVDDKMEGVDGRMERVDDKMEGVDGRMEGVDDRMEGVDDRMEGVDDRMEGVDDRMKGVLADDLLTHAAEVAYKRCHDGFMRPLHCIPRHKSAIIIPFRDRHHHFKVKV